MRRFTWAPALRGALALSIALGAGGGCLVLGYDFDKEPPVSCAAATDCPGSDACGTRVCDQGACKVLSPVPAGMEPPGQAIGDCKKVTCDGKGNDIAVADPDDKPEDGNECTDDLCVQGTPANPPSDATTKCGAADYTKCNGTGVCAGCMTAVDCGVDTPCAIWACDMDQTCVRTLQPVGTLAMNPALGDCKANLCNSIGESPEGFYGADPMDDGDECTADTCAEDFSTTHGHAADGTKCAGTCMACAAGACGACDPVSFACDGTDCKPLKKLDDGFACSVALDCVSGFCVDDVCCDSECSGTCLACKSELTGADNGKCSAVSDGTDPHETCTSPMTDLCLGGECQCFNGAKDPNELGVDCGGNCKGCPGKWVCDGVNGCEGVLAGTCCDFDCFTCSNDYSACTSVHGTPCTVGDAGKKFSLGTVSQGGCFTGTACKRVTCTCK